MSSPFVGQIMLFGGSFAPAGWAFCAGQLLSVAENSQLFKLIGNVYGGDGITTFALPDLRGRVPLGQGLGPGLSPFQLGQSVGAESVMLTTAQMPSHGHVVNGTSGGQPHPNMQPYLVFNFCIALSGANP